MMKDCTFRPRNSETPQKYNNNNVSSTKKLSSNGKSLKNSAAKFINKSPTNAANNSIHEKLYRDGLCKKELKQE